MATLGHIYQRRKARANRALYDDLVASPVTGAMTAPANARIGLRPGTSITAGDPLATLTGPSTRNITSEGLAAGDLQVVERIERGTVVTAETGVEVMLDIGLGRFAKIAEGA